MFGIDFLSLILGILVGAAMGEGTRRLINGARRKAVSEVKDIFTKED